MCRLKGLRLWNAILVLLIFSAIVVFPGCNQPDNDLVLNVPECADLLLEKIAFQDALTAISEQMIAATYQVSAEDLLQQQVYVSSGATAEEIAIFEAVDTDAAQRIETAVRQRVAEQKASFEDYLPAELPRLADPFILVRGRYVVLCISDHKEKVKEELNKLWQ